MPAVGQTTTFRRIRTPLWPSLRTGTQGVMLMERAELATIRDEFDATIGRLHAATASGDEADIQACIAALADLHLREVQLIDAEDLARRPR